MHTPTVKPISRLCPRILALASLFSYLVIAAGMNPSQASLRTLAIHSPQQQHEAVNACQPFTDGFTNATLIPGWAWADPKEDASYSLADRSGFLRLSAPTGNDLYAGTNYNAPRLLHRISGDFVVETHLEFSPQQFYQGAGILVWQDTSNFIRLEHDFFSASNISLGGYSNGIQIPGNVDDHITTAITVGLKLQRIGDVFTAYWSKLGQDWQPVRTLTLAFNQDVFLGPVLIVERNAPQISADFDNFTFSCFFYLQYLPVVKR